jgi:hypothetical protein
MGSAKRSKGAGVFDQGAGRVDLTRAIKQTVVVESGSVSFGRALWPHTDDKPIARTVTYRNTGYAPVTLSLKAQGSGPTGKAAPAGFFKLAASTLTVPAGGTARTTLTANTRVKAVDGVYSGYLTATAPGVQVQTPFAVNREVESYNVKLVHTNRDGTKAKDYVTVLTNLASFTSYDVFGAAPTTTLRLPKGNYGLFTWISTGFETQENTTDDTTTMLVQPKLTVGRSSTVKLDARLGRPLKVTVPKKDAAPTLIATGAEWTGKDAAVSAAAIADRFEGQFSAQIGPKAKVKGFTGSVIVSLARLDAAGSAAKSPYLYDLAYYRTGSFYTGFTRAVRAKELATLSATYRSQGGGVQGLKGNSARVPGVGGGFSVMTPFDLPLRRTEYVNAEKGVTWDSYFEELVPPVDDEHGPEFVAGAYQPATAYRPGRTYRQDWNRAVFGPSVRGATYAGDWLTRWDNTIAGGVPLFSDGAGHVGWSRTTSARVALYRNGRLVGESPEQFGEFAVPAAAASYRFETSAERGAPSTLSTRVQATWTFKSARVTGTKPKRLPLSSVRFSPPVDLRNTATAGRTVEIGVGIDRQAGSTATRNKSLTVEVSYDDGRTWKRVTVRGSGDARTAVVAHPATAGFVSLRATAADTAGNTVKQTVIRAYRIA